VKSVDDFLSGNFMEESDDESQDDGDDVIISIYHTSSYRTFTLHRNLKTTQNLKTTLNLKTTTLSKSMTTHLLAQQMNIRLSSQT